MIEKTKKPTIVQSEEMFLSVDLGNEERAEWLTHQDFLDWVENFEKKWLLKSLDEISYFHEETGQKIIKKFLSSLSQIKNQNQNQNYELIVTGFLSKYPWFWGQSKHPLFFNKLVKEGKSNCANIILKHWMNCSIRNDSPSEIAYSLVQWELYEHGIKSNLQEKRAAWRQLVNELDQKKSSYEQMFELQKNAFNTDQQARVDAWSDALVIQENELKALKDTYDKHMALEAPVQYWEIKRKRHRNWMWATLVLLIVSMIFAGGLLHVEIQSLGKAFELSEQAALQVAEIKDIASTSGAVIKGPDKSETLSLVTSTIDSMAKWRLGSFILIATLGFWALRLIVRVFLSNLHLENDAAERVTMAKTYLALSREGTLQKGEGFNAVLAALFRPTGDGIVKDEGIPPSVMEFITKTK